MELIEYIDAKLKIFNEVTRFEPCPEPSELKIITMSAKTEFTAKINIEKFCKIIAEKIVSGSTSTRILGIQFRDIEEGCLKKNKKAEDECEVAEEDEAQEIGEGKILDSKSLKNRFYNCASFVIKPNPKYKPLNIKLFSNCVMSMTGCKEKRDGYDAVNILISEIKNRPEVFENKSDVERLDQTGYEITMINSNFLANYKLNAAVLQKIILDKYHLFSNYEPVSYPGVKINYMWNTNNKNGICECPKKCRGKKNSICKKGTIVVFQSGRVMITGFSDTEQLDDAHEFIRNLLREEYSNIARFCITDIMSNDPENPFAKSKKSKASKKSKKPKDVEKHEDIEKPSKNKIRLRIKKKVAKN